MGTTEVSANVTAVSESAQETGETSRAVLEGATLVDTEWGTLRDAVQTFIDRVRVA